MTTIYEMLQLIKEYDNAGNVMSLAMMTKKGTSGKSLDSIAVGKTNVNKTPSHRKTRKEYQYPELSKIIQLLKSGVNALNGDKILTGVAAEEMAQLEQSQQLKTDVDGSFILPFGDNIRMRKINGVYSIGHKDVEKSPITTTDKQLTLLSLPLT